MEEFQQIPDFYGCYLLQSISKRQSFYIGSTPNPVRRLRQHNGSLSRGGAYRTKRDGTRPWEMVAIVYGFPSRIAALQFEHAWQHGYQTRYIKSQDRVVKTRKGGRSIHHKLAMITSLLKNEYFRYMDLTLHFFNQKVEEIWKNDKFNVSQTQESIDNNYTVSLSQDALTEINNDTIDDIMDVNEKNMELVQNLYSTTLAEKTKTFLLYKEKIDTGINTCQFCNKIIKHNLSGNISENLFAFCRDTSCTFVSHLACAYRYFMSNTELPKEDTIIPQSPKCPKCYTLLKWCDVIYYSIKLNKDNTTADDKKKAI